MMRTRVLNPVMLVSSVLAVSLLLNGCAMSRQEKFQHDLTLAQQGDVDAQDRVGEAYVHRHDYVHGIEWLEKAAAKGNTRAQKGLSDMYYQGLGFPVDKVKSLYWQELAAKNGDVDAMYTVGDIYLGGDGKEVPQNAKKAAQWYEAAAEHGDIQAHYALGLLYSGRTVIYGEGTLRDLPKSRYHLKQASEGGYEDAPFLYAQMLRSGKGGKVDNVEAYVWFVKASSAGSFQHEAKQYLQSLIEEMPESEYQEAQSRLAHNVVSDVVDKVSLKGSPRAFKWNRTP